jgi:hypothetical protein
VTAGRGFSIWRLRTMHVENILRRPSTELRSGFFPRAESSYKTSDYVVWLPPRTKEVQSELITSTTATN